MVTMLVNVPLNNVLAGFVVDQSSAAEISAQRLGFESQWNKFHMVRTLAALSSLGLTIVAAIVK